jgi:Niemann-Pick C1 protein
MKLSSLRWVALATSLSSLLSPTIAADEGWTIKHEKGRCAIRGHCGSEGFFGRQLPCPDNGVAEDPDDDVRKKLVAVCGDSWAKSKVCCEAEQV